MKRKRLKRKSCEIGVIPIEPTAIIGVRDTGKSRLMFSWAHDFILNGINFVYFIGEEQIPRLESGQYDLKNVPDTLKHYVMSIKKSIVLGSAAIVPVGQQTTWDEIETALVSAIDDGWFIFIDDNPFQCLILDHLSACHYKNLAVALRCLSTLYKHSSEQFRNYRFERVVAGKTDNPFASTLFGMLGFSIGTTDLFRCKYDEFYVLEKTA